MLRKCFELIMKSKKSSLIWILLSFIILFTGMCSEIERTDSCFAISQNIEETDSIVQVKNDSLYFGNCTSKLITGLRNISPQSRRGQGRISFRNYAEFLWIREILQMLSYVCIAALFVCQPIERSKAAILEFIHKQDGEK